jgi:hypothetical protein
LHPSAALLTIRALFGFGQFPKQTAGFAVSGAVGGKPPRPLDQSADLLSPARLVVCSRNPMNGLVFLLRLPIAAGAVE